MTNTDVGPDDAAALPIAAVERDTGIGKDTLRAWERRYGFPAPLRDATGERLYPAQQVRKLRLVRRLLDQGMRPGRLLAIGDEELEALAGRLSRARVSLEADLERLLDMVRGGRGDALRGALAQALMKRGLQGFVLDVAAPLNVAVGEAWNDGSIDVFAEHLYTEQLQNVLRAAIHTQSVRTGRPRMLLTTFPDEGHGLGLLMAEAMFCSEGAWCVSLGTRTPVSEIRAAAVAADADIVAISLSAAYPARQALADVTELRRHLPPGIALWAGGAGAPRADRVPSEVDVVADFGDALDQLHAWRAARAGNADPPGAA